MVRARRRKLTFVDVYPGHDGDPAVERFVEQCSPVFTLYTWGLSEGPLKIAATSSWMRITATQAPLSAWKGTDQVAADIVLPEEPPDNLGASESPWVVIDPALVNLPPSERGLAYLGWLHSAMVRVARFRGWDEEPLEQARHYCLDRNLLAHFGSPRKQSPDRLHKAVLTLDIEPDGWRRIAITVTDRSDVVVRRESKLWRPFHYDVNSWREVRSRFRWTAPRVVTAPGYLPLTLDLDAPPVPDEDLPVDLRNLDPIAGQTPEAIAYREWTQATGGSLLDHLTGSLNGMRTIAGFVVPTVPSGAGNLETGLRSLGTSEASPYDLLFGGLIMAMESDETWQSWWSPVGLPGELTSEIWSEGQTVDRAVKIRRLRDRVTISFVRPPPDANSDPMSEATADFHDVVAAIRRRFDLGPPPAAPTFERALTDG